jgi:uncharacterized protein YbbC (DUF1343 family)
MIASPVTPGLDALRAGHADEVLAALRGRRIGLLTNHTGVARDGASTLSILREELGLNVCALFSPEHGFSGTREGHVESSTHAALPVHSLYGETRRPTREMLGGIEVLVCDLQDVGARFYTYSTTLAYCLEECAQFGIAVVALDRPNPLGGVFIEGPLVDEQNKSFVGYLDVPIRHGMTLGELALLHKADKALDVELHIARVLGWRRDMLWANTQLKWPVPSPNLPSAVCAFWYPGICLLEFSGVSVGRGTNAPFQIVGAPWMDASRVLDAMEQWPDEVRANFSAEAIRFTPTRGEHEGVLCHGIRLRIADRGMRIPSQTVPLGLCLLSTLRATHNDFNIDKCLTLLGSSEVLELLKVGRVEAAFAVCGRAAGEFEKQRRKLLIY